MLVEKQKRSRKKIRRIHGQKPRRRMLINQGTTLQCKKCAGTRNIQQNPYTKLMTTKKKKRKTRTKLTTERIKLNQTKQIDRLRSKSGKQINKSMQKFEINQTKTTINSILKTTFKIEMGNRKSRSKPVQQFLYERTTKSKAGQIKTNKQSKKSFTVRTNHTTHEMQPNPTKRRRETLPKKARIKQQDGESKSERKRGSEYLLVLERGSLEERGAGTLRMRVRKKIEGKRPKIFKKIKKGAIRTEFENTREIIRRETFWVAKFRK